MKKKAQFSGSSFNIFSFIILSFLCVVLFGGLIYSMHVINDVMHQIGVTNDATPRTNWTYPCIDNISNTCGSTYYVNMTLASDQIFGQQATSIQALRMVAIVYILGLAAIIIITNVFLRKHPILFFAYILVSILAIVFAAPISNAYETLMNSGIYEGGLLQFSTANTLLLNLPTVVLVISVIGAVFSLLNIIRSGGEDTSL